MNAGAVAGWASDRMNLKDHVGQLFLIKYIDFVKDCDVNVKMVVNEVAACTRARCLDHTVGSLNTV